MRQAHLGALTAHQSLPPQRFGLKYPDGARIKRTQIELQLDLHRNGLRVVDYQPG
jgi:hypothetical protein